MRDKNKEPRNEKGEGHGHWEIYNPDGTLWCKGHIINGEWCGYLYVAHPVKHEISYHAK